MHPPHRARECDTLDTPLSTPWCTRQGRIRCSRGRGQHSRGASMPVFGRQHSFGTGGTQPPDAVILVDVRRREHRRGTVVGVEGLDEADGVWTECGAAIEALGADDIDRRRIKRVSCARCVSDCRTVIPQKTEKLFRGGGVCAEAAESALQRVSQIRSRPAIITIAMLVTTVVDIRRKAESVLRSHPSWRSVPRRAHSPGRLFEVRMNVLSFISPEKKRKKRKGKMFF